MTRSVTLTKGYVALVDDEDYARVMAEGPWCACVQTNNVYAVRGRRKADGPGAPLIPLHRFLMNAQPGQMVDHMNRDSLDNRRSNLRFAQKAENAVNTGPSVLNTSGFRGVIWHKAGRRWMAQIGGAKNHRYLGLHSTPEEAARAYDRAAQDMYGDFAVLNFPNEETAA